MCRWFAYISPSEPCLLEDVLVTPSHSLAKQIHQHYLPKLLSHDPAVHAEPTTQAEITERNRLFNVDGFGMAWYSPVLSSFSPSKSSTPKPDLYPVLYKNIQPPLHDSNFRSIVSNTASKVLFAHIRAATSTAIVPTNNHPFTFGVYTIMHNGYISDFTKIKRAMCEQMTQETYEHIEGGTDSEHFAALYMSILSKRQGEGEWSKYSSTHELGSALIATIAIIVQLQQALLKDKAEPNDLNIAITDGRSFVACRFRNHATEQPPSLYYSETAGPTLNRQFPDHPDEAGHNPYATQKASDHGKHVIVASEPSTWKDKEWSLIEKNHAVLVDEKGHVQVETMRTMVPEGVKPFF